MRTPCAFRVYAHKKHNRGSNIGLAAYARFGIRKILRAGYGVKIAWRDWDALSSIGGMRGSFEIVSWLRDSLSTDILFSQKIVERANENNKPRARKIFREKN